jgi:hypothetical protein
LGTNSLGFVGGKVGKTSRGADWYPTPANVTRALVKFCKPTDVVWEPACGDGSMSRVLEEAGLRVLSTDLHPKGYGEERDFLTARLPVGVTSIVTNPPFNLAAEFIMHALALKPSFVAMLLKATFWNAARRLPLFRSHRPLYMLPLTWRPDFFNLGRPMLDVMWCVWMPQSPTAATIFLPLERPHGT